MGTRAVIVEIKERNEFLPDDGGFALVDLLLGWTKLKERLNLVKLRQFVFHASHWDVKMRDEHTVSSKDRVGYGMPLNFRFLLG